MDTNEFYDYLLKTFNLDGTSCRLVRNILDYVEEENFLNAEDAHTHLEALLDGAFGLTEQEIKLYGKEVDSMPTKTEMSNYQKLMALFPDVMSGEYVYLKLSAGEAFMPLSVEWIGGNRLSIMHTTTLNGDLMYDPMMVFEVDRLTNSVRAVEFEQSLPPVYQRIEEDGVGHSVDGNGRQKTIQDLQKKLGDFASLWLKNIEGQGYVPIRGIACRDGEDREVSFDKFGKEKKPSLAETLAKHAEKSREMFGDMDQSAPQRHRDER